MDKRLYCSILLFCSLITVLLLSSCHFGDDEDGLETLAKKKRELSYSTRLAFYPCLESNDSIVDHGVDGLFVNFGDSADIAVMGKEFQIQYDTTGSASWPYPKVLSYRQHIDLAPTIEGQYSSLSFDFKSYGKHSNGEKYATCIHYLYPASQVIDRKGYRLKARVDSVPYNFAGQDGTLKGLRRYYFPALGSANAICSKNQVVMLDSTNCVAAHNHDSLASQVVLLDPKVAILRLSLAVAAQRDFPLLQYLEGLRMSGLNYYVDRIELRNVNESAPSFSRPLLNLRTGWMETTDTSLPYIVLTDELKFWRHDQIELDAPESLEKVGGNGATWGTLVYVSVPCVQEGTLDTEWQVVVYLTELGSTPVNTKKLYGNLQPARMLEGSFYLTSPVLLYKTQEEAVHPAQIYRVQ